MHKPLLILFLSFLINLTSFGQFYNTGQAPFSVKWQIINTEHFQVIYPDGFYDKANKVSNLLTYYYDRVAYDYPVKPKKISVLLNNQSVLSNGFVAWAPRRMEWNTTPPQESYPQDWLEQLAIHEFRHVVQITNLEQGLTRILKLVFGEAAAGAVAAYLPLWFLEGDAVMFETAFSEHGRGRLPEFDMELRAIEEERSKRFSYNQSYLGSYKYFIPNYYKYGYQIVTFGNIKYNSKIWNNSLALTGKHPYLIAPFNIGLKKATGFSKEKLYVQAFDSLNILWNNNKSIHNSFDTSNIAIPSCDDYFNYKYVQKAGNKLFAVKEGLDDITRFVVINDTTETVIYTPGRYYGTKVSIGTDYAVWEEIIPDARWEQRNYSVIKVMHLNTGKVVRISSKSRYFSPTLSPKGNRLGCIEINLMNEYSLVLLELPTGNLLTSIPVNNYTEISSPAWINDTHIAFIAFDKKGKHIITMDINSQQMEHVFEAQNRNIDHLSANDDKLFFACDVEKERNIYAFDLKTNKIYRVTRSEYGADFPHYDSCNGTLYYSDYTLAGYRPASKKLNSKEYTEYKDINPYMHPWAEELTKWAGNNPIKEEINVEYYSTKPYNRWSHSLNIHSWAPFYMDPDKLAEFGSDIYPGFIFFSQNKLSTVTASFGYYYKNSAHHIKPEITLQGMYPVFAVAGHIVNKPAFYEWPDSTDFPFGAKSYYGIEVKSYLPLDLTRNKFSRYLKPEISYNYLNIYLHRNGSTQKGLNIVGISLSGYNLIKQSFRDIIPRFGQAIFISYHKPINNLNFFGSVFTLGVNQYLPGLFRHHAIRISVGYERHENEKDHILEHQILLPRGISQVIPYDRIFKTSINYTLPILYPDWSIGPLVYIKRFHVTAYTDAAQISYNSSTGAIPIAQHETFMSPGIILSAELHFFRFFMPFTPNFRISYISPQNCFNTGFDITINTKVF